MPIRGLLKKKDKLDPEPNSLATEVLPPPPEFTFLRSDTHTQEVIALPDHPSDDEYYSIQAASGGNSSDGEGGHRGRFSRLTGGRSRSQSTTSNASRTSEKSKERRSPNSKRLSQRLGLRKEDSSAAVPRDLPDIEGGGDSDGDGDAWEERATILAMENERNRSRPVTPVDEDLPNVGKVRLGGGVKDRVVASKYTDDNIQEAIRLHEAGELEEATRMFGRLADPNGENNALSQVLYALALRHAWGCTADPEKAMEYLSAAAANAASIESEALQSGRKGGGAAKGELVLAIFELANSFRQGWGVKKDPIAAKQYYETAANLGDTDAMNEVGWCYLEGFGCKKDKLKSAKYYRLAEAGGNKILGNSWIWKPKYDQPKP